MKWLRRNNDNSNYEDRRGRISKGGIVGGGIGGIVLVVLAMLFGVDPDTVTNIVNTVAPPQDQETVDPSRAHEYEEWKDFSLNVFNSCNEVWDDIFTRELNRKYSNPTLVTYTDQTTSECGGASSQMGPFYCPIDQKVYIDLSFFKELAERFKAPGDLAMAYVTAHEMGHHVQNLLGILDRFHALHGKVSEADYNKMSVRVELQADFFAGIWAYHAQKLGIIQLEEGDLETALRAANAIGDDTLQKAAQGHTVPDTFTHGTSEQRMKWFKLGYTSGNIALGDQFEDL